MGFEWEGNCEWHAKHGSRFPCWATASLTFTVQDKEKLHRHLLSELKKNPFLSAEEIYRILAREIESGLDDDLEAFCNADDYYEPYLEEFVGYGTGDSEENWDSWGLKITEFTGSGDVDFEVE